VATHGNNVDRVGNLRHLLKKTAMWLSFAVLFAAPPSTMPAQQTAASLQVTSPAADGATVSGIYSFAVDASAFPNAATVEFDIASLRLGVAQTAPYAVSWNTGYGKDGNYSLQVIARDTAGRVIATGERVFNIANSGITMYAASHDLSKELSGMVKLQVAAHDPTNYPAIFNLFIDGELSGYWDNSSGPVTNSATAVFNLDTTRFSNGKHELVIDLKGWKEPASPHTYANYSAMLDRVITINNGHALIEIAANYQHVYLQPGQTLSLSCNQLFADNVSAPCSAPAYGSDNPAVASVSGSGLIQGNGNGFTVIGVSDSGKTAKVYVWVKANLNIPHFSGNGQILNSYRAGNSVFPVAPFVLDPYYMQPDTITETRRAAFNTVSFGFYLNTRQTAISYPDWKYAQDNIITSRILWAKNNGFHIMGTGDDGFRRPGDDAWWTLNWPYGRQATQYAMQTLAESGVAIAVDVVDEAPVFWGWYPLNPSKVGQQGLPGQPSSFQSVACTDGVCSVNWPKHGYSAGRWIGFQGSTHPELNTLIGQPFTILRATQDSFDFVANGSITDTFTSDNDPDLEFMLFASWPCNGRTNDGMNHPCAPFTANDAVKTYSNWLRGAASRVPFSWSALGLLPATAQANWVGQSAVDRGFSDYASHYWDVLSGSRTYSWSNGVQQRTFWMKDSFYSRQPYMAQDRPQLMLVCGSSFAYIKQTAGGAYYNPLGDTLDEPGCDGSIATAEMMTAVALGNAGIRQYQFDIRTPGDRGAYPVGAYLETGMRPDAVERNSREIWQAAGYVSNLLTKVLQPYILGTAASSPAYQRGITTAVRRGTDATMLMVVNGNDAERTVNIDFTPYKTGTAIARYRLSYFLLQSDLLPDTPGDSVILPKGGSVVYLFPFSADTSFLKSVSFRREFPVGASQAMLSYNYIYGEHLSQFTDGVECTSGCSMQLDTRLGDIYYQFTYADTNGKVISRSDVLKFDPASQGVTPAPTPAPPTRRQ